MDTQTLCQYLENLLKHLFQELLDSPKEAVIEVIGSDRSISVSIITTDGDRGKLIGLRGRNADAIRTLCGAVCARYKYHFHLTVIGAQRRD